MSNGEKSVSKHVFRLSVHIVFRKYIHIVIHTRARIRITIYGNINKIT